MKIPVYQRQVNPSSAGVPNAVGSTPDTNTEAIARGAGNYGSAVDQAVAEQERKQAEYQRKVDEAQHKADVVAARNALTAWQNNETTLMHGDAAAPPPSPDVQKLSDAGDQGASQADLGLATPAPAGQPSPGFLATRGMDAHSTSADTFDALRKNQQDLAGSLANDKQRELFLSQSDELLLSSRRRIEEHVAQQTSVVEQDSLNGARTSALNTIANNYTDPEIVRQQVAGVIGPAHALLAGRPEAQKQFEAELAADVAKVRLNQYIANKNWKGAQAVFAQTREQLGVQATHFETVINTERDKQLADQRAIDIVDSTRNAWGFTDTAKAIATFQSLPQEQRTEEAQQAFGKWLQLEAAKKKSAVDSGYDSALGTYLGRHHLADVPAATEVWLKAVDPESWRKLEQMQKADRAHARGLPATPAQARALAQFRLWASDNPDLAAQMSEAEFNRSWAPQLATQDRDNGISVLVQYHAFANKPEKMANGIDAAVLEAGGKGGAGVLPTDQRNKAAWEPEALDVYARATSVVQQKANEYRRKNGGKEPTSEDLRKWSTDLFLTGKDPARGFLGFGGNTTLIESSVKGTGFEPNFSGDQKAAAAAELQKAGARVDDAAVNAFLRLKAGIPALPVQAKTPGETTLPEMDFSQPTSADEATMGGGAGGGAGDTGAGY